MKTWLPIILATGVLALIAYKAGKKMIEKGKEGLIESLTPNLFSSRTPETYLGTKPIKEVPSEQPPVPYTLDIRCYIGKTLVGIGENDYIRMEGIRYVPEIASDLRAFQDRIGAIKTECAEKNRILTIHLFVQNFKTMWGDVEHSKAYEYASKVLDNMNLPYKEIGFEGNEKV